MKADQMNLIKGDEKMRPKSAVKKYMIYAHRFKIYFIGKYPFLYSSNKPSTAINAINDDDNSCAKVRIRSFEGSWTGNLTKKSNVMKVSILVEPIESLS